MAGNGLVTLFLFPLVLSLLCAVHLLWLPVIQAFAYGFGNRCSRSPEFERRVWILLRLFLTCSTNMPYTSRCQLYGFTLTRMQPGI
ncbi:hypothetical protein C8R47DRAFT_1154011, partial [Mycena vitilis]